jgi:hypothetical protein
MSALSGFFARHRGKAAVAALLVGLDALTLGVGGTAALGQLSAHRPDKHPFSVLVTEAPADQKSEDFTRLANAYLARLENARGRYRTLSMPDIDALRSKIDSRIALLRSASRELQTASRLLGEGDVVASGAQVRCMVKAVDAFNAAHPDLAISGHFTVKAHKAADALIGADCDSQPRFAMN